MSLSSFFVVVCKCVVFGKITPLTINRIYTKICENFGTLCKIMLNYYERNTLLSTELTYVHFCLKQECKSHLPSFNHFIDRKKN